MTHDTSRFVRKKQHILRRGEYYSVYSVCLELGLPFTRGSSHAWVWPAAHDVNRTFAPWLLVSKSRVEEGTDAALV